jgi:ribonucleoside-diphosphate reductase alpha chain
MKYMDHLIDFMDFPDQRFKDMSQKYRQIGIGVMGLSDTLYEMDLPYDSAEGREHVSKMMKTISTACIEASADMAKDKGKFYEYDFFEKDVLEIIPNWIDDKKVLDKVKKNGLRNSLFNTVAPTGTIAISCDCSYGIEPCFGLVTTKTLSETGEKMNMVNPIFQKRFEKESWYTPDLLDKISQNKGSLKNLRGIPKEVRDVFVVAHDIKPKDRIDMQADIQKYVSAAISSTLNLPETATRDEVSEIYRYAYSKGLKGITIYRDGSKKFQPISFSKEKQEVQSNFIRPSKLQANVHTIETGNGKLYVTISTHNGKPVEMFISIGKSGQTFNTFTEALGRTISIAFQHGVPVENIIKTLIGINSDRPIWSRIDENDKKPDQILSIPDALAKLLKRYYTNGQVLTGQESGEFCSKCGTYNLIMIEGCSTCTNCAESRCS